MGLMPLVLASILTVFIVTLLLSKYVSLGSILASLALPLFTFLSFHLRHVDGDPAQPTLWAAGTWNKPLLVFSILTCILAVWRHRANIWRLRAGTESRLFGGKKPHPHES